jgi:hypothetical protein
MKSSSFLVVPCQQAADDSIPQRERRRFNLKGWRSRALECFGSMGRAKLGLSYEGMLFRSTDVVTEGAIGNPRLSVSLDIPPRTLSVAYSRQLEPSDCQLDKIHISSTLETEYDGLRLVSRGEDEALLVVVSRFLAQVFRSSFKLLTEGMGIR